jgi:hypothetical protein
MIRRRALVFSDDIISNIESLPRDLQAKLCIHVWRKFWREYIPLTAQSPSWRIRQLKIEKELFDSRLQNIHFLHLSFNTLSENKQWIPGCQCDHCKDIPLTPLKYLQLREITKDPDHFNELIRNHLEGSYDYYVESADDPELIETIINGPGLKENVTYDPLCGTIYEASIQCNLRENNPIEFTDYTDPDDLLSLSDDSGYG